MKFYNEMEQSWRKLKQDCPEVAKAIEESDEREIASGYGWGAHSKITTIYGQDVLRAPMQTEAEKFFEKWGGKKIWQEGMGRHSYHLVTRVMDHNKVYIKNQDGKCGHIVLRASDNWQLWESPIKLDTRKVAGWWCSTLGAEDGRLVYCVDLQNGAWLRMFGTSELKLNVLDSEYTFSKDPSAPLDQWQTLEEICGVSHGM